MQQFIHKFIPSATGDNAPTLVLLHGTGGNEEDLLPLGKYLAPDAALLGIRGQVTEGSAPRYFRRLAEGVFDQEDLIFRTHELARFIEQAVTEYSLNSERLIAVGYSNGANIAASMLLLEPAILSAAILYRAMVPLTPETLPDLAAAQVLMLSGKQDPIIPPENSEQLADLLQQAGADVTVRWQHTGHGLIDADFELAKSWIGKLITT